MTKAMWEERRFFVFFLSTSQSSHQEDLSLILSGSRGILHHFSFQDDELEAQSSFVGITTLDHANNPVG